MRFAVSSSSEASADEDEQPMVDLRASAGRKAQWQPRSSSFASTSKPAETSPVARPRSKALPPWIKARQQQQRQEPRVSHRSPSSQSSPPPAFRPSPSSSSPSPLSSASESEGEDDTLPVTRRRPPPRGAEAAAINSIRIAGEEEAWEGAWVDALRRSSSGWGRLMSRSPRSPTPSTDSKPAPSKTAAHDDLDWVESQLSRMRLEKDAADRQSRTDFEARERKLWQSIETAIRAAEDEAASRAKEEAERLAAARKAQEESERKAKEDREREERKIAEEAAAKKLQAEERDKSAKKAAEQAAEQAADAKRAQEQQEKTKTLMAPASDEYEHWRGKMSHIKTEVLPVVSSNADWRKQCFAAKRQITPKIGQLTNSQQEIARITTSLCQLLNDAKSAPSPSIYIWMLNHLAKCLIRQAEQEVSVKLDTAFPLARVVVSLLQQGHAELGNVLMARLVKKSPWTLGFAPSRSSSDADDAAFSKRMGKASVDETTVQFANRQSGIVGFYFAICQTAGSSAANSDGETIPPHLRPSALWKWQARCATPPMTRHAVVPALWCTLIEIAGAQLLATYGKQCAKVWRLIYQQGIMEGKAEVVKLEEGKANSGRLQLLLEDWSKSGSVQPAKGSVLAP
ncbi:unnamed protein product [Jaminaea pallidilutea]